MLNTSSLILVVGGTLAAIVAFTYFSSPNPESPARPEIPSPAPAVAKREAKTRSIEPSSFSAPTPDKVPEVDQVPRNLTGNNQAAPLPQPQYVADSVVVPVPQPWRYSPATLEKVMKLRQRSSVVAEAVLAQRQSPVAVPLALFEPTDDLQLTEPQKEDMAKLAQEFYQAIEADNPAVKVDDPDYLDRWRKAQKKSDEQLRARIGWEAFNRLYMQIQPADQL